MPSPPMSPASNQEAARQEGDGGTLEGTSGSGTPGPDNKQRGVPHGTNARLLVAHPCGPPCPCSELSCQNSAGMGLRSPSFDFSLGMMSLAGSHCTEPSADAAHAAGSSGPVDYTAVYRFLGVLLHPLLLKRATLLELIQPRAW